MSGPCTNGRKEEHHDTLTERPFGPSCHLEIERRLPKPGDRGYQVSQRMARGVGVGGGEEALGEAGEGSQRSWEGGSGEKHPQPGSAAPACRARWDARPTRLLSCTINQAGDGSGPPLPRVWSTAPGRTAGLEPAGAGAGNAVEPNQVGRDGSQHRRGLDVGGERAPARRAP